MTGETMTDVKPALTKEEWAYPPTFEEEGGAAVSVNGSDLTVTDLQTGDGLIIDAAKTLALANHALPDGHPLKLMGEDIQLLGAAAFAFRELSAYAETDHSRGVRLEYEQHVLALSRKLAALLPP